MDVTRAGHLQTTTAIDAGSPRALGNQVKIGELLLSQSGSTARARDGHEQQPIAAPGAFKELVVTGLSPSGTRFENRFPIDERGMLQAGPGRPLGHVPYEVALIAADGTKYAATVDVTPRKTGVSHSGYDLIKDLTLTKAAPPAPDSFRVTELLLSQSGQIALARDGHKQQPLVPGQEGTFTELSVTGLSPSGTRTTNTYAIGEDGKLQWSLGQPLGHVPYELTLKDEGGNLFKARVDITPSRIKISHSGYELLQGLKFERVVPQAPADAEGVRNFVSQAPVEKKMSPLAAFWNK